MDARVAPTPATVTPLPVKHLINTLYQRDHAGGDEEMLKRGVEVVVQENLRPSYYRTKVSGDTPYIVFGNYGAVYLGGVKVEMYDSDLAILAETCGLFPGPQCRARR